MAEKGALEGKLVVLMGGSGFLGNYVAQALLERGARLRLASRNPQKAFGLKPLANLGQLQFTRCNVHDRDSVTRCIENADAVINLVGSFEGDLRQLMGESAGWMAQAAAGTGAQAFVHVSAIAADPEGESEYAAAKRLGEDLVFKAFPSASVLRPSILFGEDDKFLSMFGGLISSFPILPVFGPDARMQPVYVGDVAEAIVCAVGDPASFGRTTFELAGPEVLTMMELNRRIAKAQQRERRFLPIPDSVSSILAAMPGSPMSSDQWRLLKGGSVASGDLPGFGQFAIVPKPLGLFLDQWMVRYRKHGRFSVHAGV